MKKIKRTITIRKVEINGQHIVQSNDENIKVCPVCQSPMHLSQQLSDSINSKFEKKTLQLGDDYQVEINGEKND